MISFRAQQRTFHRRQIAESEFQQFARNLGDGLLVLRRVTHNATFTHLPFAHFEMGFDQNQQVGGGRKQGDERGRINVTEINETSIVTRSARVPIRSELR